MSITTVILVLALVAFALAAAGLTWKKTDLIAIGLALWALAAVEGDLSHLTLATVILLLAFVAFVAAAIGWKLRKLNMIAVGLALWILSLLVGRFA